MLCRPFAPTHTPKGTGGSLGEGSRLHYTNRVLDVVVDGFGVDVGLVDLDDAPVGEHAWPHGRPIALMTST